MASNIIIASDSTSDLSKDIIEKYNIKIMPLNVVKDDKSYRDGIDATQKDVFEYKEKTGKLMKSAAPNISDWEEFYNSFPENEGVVCFSISSEMSSSFANSSIAAKGKKNFFNVDSRNLSTGIGLLIVTACQYRELGYSAEEIYERVEELKSYVDASFVLDTLEYLHKGGRCSGVAALGANLLKLKPCIEVAEGEMGVGKKYRGKLESVLLDYVKYRLSNIDDVDDNMIFVTHTMREKDQYMVDSVKDYLKQNYNFKNVFETRAGCTVSVHCGPDTLGILFIRKSKVTK